MYLTYSTSFFFIFIALSFPLLVPDHRDPGGRLAAHRTTTATAIPTALRHLFHVYAQARSHGLAIVRPALVRTSLTRRFAIVHRTVSLLIWTTVSFWKPSPPSASLEKNNQIIVPANRPDDCSTEQPPKCDAAACPVQSPNDDVAVPVSPPNDETEIMDVMSSNDDDTAGPALPSMDDADLAPPSMDDADLAPPSMDDPDLAPPPNNDAAEMSDVVMSSQDDDAASSAPPPKEDASAALLPKEDAIPAPPPKEDAIPAPPPKEDAIPAPPPKEDAIPAPPLKEDAIPAPPLKEDAIPAPPPKEEAIPADESIPLEPNDQPGCSYAGKKARVLKKKKIKHETIDLGNDTYFYDDNNKAILIKGHPKVGFERGLEPDHIVGATEQDGKLMFLIAWKNSEIADLLESTVVYEKAPQIAIRFFEARLRYCPGNEQE